MSARALAHAIEAFKGWGIRIPVSGRSREAEKWLLKIAERGEFGESEEDLARTSSAAALAADLYLISTTLGSENNKFVAKEIENVLKGELVGGSSSAKAYEAQAQFWIGTLLTQSKFRVEVLGYEPKGRKPDFVIEAKTLKYAVEIKRPMNEESMIRAVDKAGKQIRDFGKPGIIVVDLSSCVQCKDTKLPKNQSNVQEYVHSLASQMHNNMTSRVELYTKSDRFNKVALVMSYARYYYWTQNPEPKGIGRIVFFVNRFEEACSGLITRQSRFVQESITEGIRQVSGNEPEVRWVR